MSRAEMENFHNGKSDIKAKENNLTLSVPRTYL